MSFFDRSDIRIDVDHGDVMHRGLDPRRLRAMGVPDAAILSGYKRVLKARVDAMAESLRGRVTTPGTGQAMEYQETVAQAAAADRDPSAATAERYPMLATTIGIDIDPQTGEPAADVLGVARCILATSEAWRIYATAIRGARLAAKRAVDAAATAEEAMAAADGAAWPSAG